MINEKEKLSDLKIELESFINSHSLDIEIDQLSKISEIIIKIRTFEIKFKHNYNSMDLIGTGLMKRPGLFGIIELKETYRLIFELTEILLELNFIDFEIENK